MSSRIAYNSKEVELLARLIKAEALGEGQEGMLLVGNVVVNRVAAVCDVFKNVVTITEAIYQKNAFAGVGTDLFNGPVKKKKKELAFKQLKVIGMLQQHMRYGSKTLGIMLLAQKHFMENFRVDLRIIVFIIPDQI